jgi:hypothetical protein
MNQALYAHMNNKRKMKQKKKKKVLGPNGRKLGHWRCASLSLLFPLLHDLAVSSANVTIGPKQSPWPSDHGPKHPNCESK